MPYINLYNTFIKYIPLTGIRAILADHGQNDNREKDPEIILDNYKIFIRQARADLDFPQLAFVVNRQTPPNSLAVRPAQEQMIKEPSCFPGPDYDQGLLKEDRGDGIHLSESGLPKAAEMWAKALTTEFLKPQDPGYLPFQNQAGTIRRSLIRRSLLSRLNSTYFLES